MMNETCLVVSTRYRLNPELARRDIIVEETEAMRSKTIDFLTKLDTEKPVVVLRCDDHNIDPNAVGVWYKGQLIGFIAREESPEIRQRLSMLHKEICTAKVVDVTVHAHGWFRVTKPDVSGEILPFDLRPSWAQWSYNELILVPENDFQSEETLREIIDTTLLPDAENQVEALKEYFTLWLEKVRFITSQEVTEAQTKYISILAAKKDSELHKMARELKKWIARKGASENIAKMVKEWWQNMQTNPQVLQQWETLCAERAYDDKELGIFFETIERMLYELPGNLYNDIGSLSSFFSHLNYLNPPQSALKGILSLLLLRCLLCQRLGISGTPHYKPSSEKKLFEEQEVKIKKIFDFSDSFCETREEKAGVERLLNWLYREINGEQEKNLDELSKCRVKQPTTYIEHFNGTVSGNVAFNSMEELKMIE